MRLREELQLRQLIRSIIRETRIKPNRGWEGYEQGLDVDNFEIDAGYPAAYYEQFADATLGMYHVSELDAGGSNVISRREQQKAKKAKKTK